jgi:hypothetical protein
MTRKEYLSKLTNELHYDDKRMRVVLELLSAAPDNQRMTSMKRGPTLS